jgi:DNA-binding NtrC family response regulator
VNSTSIFQVKAADVVSMPGARLLVLRGPDKGRALRLDKEEVVIGSAPSADLQLTDETVSRSHCALRLTPQGWLLSDLDSTNGTRVDDRRIRSVYLALGDKIDVGKTRLRLEGERKTVELAISTEQSFGELKGASIAMRRIFALLARVAPQDVTVLLLGESGTGKDAAAVALHEASPRAQGPLMILDCGAVAPGLLESELFGHERGAFTGAVAPRLGAFREAHKGTLFLDEIGELPKDLQPKLLRALEAREVRPLGGAKLFPVDVRIIAATNRDLKLDVNRGLFREDLFYRLNVVSLRMPALRERPEDVPLLATHFWRLFTGDARAELPEEMLEPLLQHAWPGNVRELRNRMERAAALGHKLEITGARPASAERPFHDAKAEVVDAFERSYLAALLQRTDGNQSEAARRAQLDRVHLTRLLKKHGLR